MATFDIFNNDAFSVSQLTGTIVDIPRVPTLLGDMGIFSESGITTPSFMIERKGAALNLVPTAPRGGVGQTLESTNRKLITLSTVHLPQRDAILADVVYGIRAFGSETEVESLSTVVRERMVQMRTNLDLTLEYHRLGALKGLVVDADGSTPILNVYTAFGMTQTVQYWNIATASTTIDPTELTANLKSTIRAKLGGRSYTRVRVICSSGFLKKFRGHNKMKEAYALWREGAFLRSSGTSPSGARVDFEFDDVVFTVYEGEVGGNELVEDGYAYAYPEGVPGMFRTVYSPADYMETVNTVGVPYYAKQERMRFDKGVELEAQSNPLCFNQLPETVIKLSVLATAP